MSKDPWTDPDPQPGDFDADLEGGELEVQRHQGKTAIRIWSHWRGEGWSGDVELPAGTTAERLEFIFRYFNRVEYADEQRLAAIGYTLPSLSMGDCVDLDGQRWVCAALGWRPA